MSLGLRLYPACYHLRPLYHFLAPTWGAYFFRADGKTANPFGTGAYPDTTLALGELFSAASFAPAAIANRSAPEDAANKAAASVAPAV